MTKREKKRQWWRERIEEQKQSGISLAQFCRQENIAYKNMLRWRAEFAAEIEDCSKSAFQELVHQPQIQDLDLSCGNCQLKIPGNLEGEQLTRILIAMNRAAVILC